MLSRKLGKVERKSRSFPPIYDLAGQSVFWFA